MRKLVISASVLAAMLLPTMATGQVQAVDQYINRVTVAFTGVVTNDVANTIMIRQPDGSFTKFTGPVPDYPYKVGDKISISFDSIVPNRDFYDQPQYAGQKAADGIYRFTPTASLSTNPISGFTTTSTPDISGPGAVVSSTSAPYRLTGLTVVYDANANSYSLELPQDSWRLSSIEMPSYQYNPSTGALTSANRSCIGAECEPNLVLFGDKDSAAIGNLNSFGPTAVDTIRIGSTQTPEAVGFFESLRFSGGWNLPFFGGGGGTPTPVPEPGMTIIFAAAAAALMRRRRKTKA